MSLVKFQSGLFFLTLLSMLFFSFLFFLFLVKRNTEKKYILLLEFSVKFSTGAYGAQCSEGAGR